MANRKNGKCLEHGCDKAPYCRGFCREHNEIKTGRDKLQADAITALHRTTVDGALPTSPECHKQLMDIRKWWTRACDAINYKRVDPILRDEAEFATEWCISLAKEIVSAERAFKSGAPPSYMLEHTISWVYERIGNLEKGLMSNGVPRTTR